MSYSLNVLYDFSQVPLFLGCNNCKQKRLCVSVPDPLDRKAFGLPGSGSVSICTDPNPLIYVRKIKLKLDFDSTGISTLA